MGLKNKKTSPNKKPAPGKRTLRTPKIARGAKKGRPGAATKPDLPPKSSAQESQPALTKELAPVFAGSDAQKARALVKYRDLGTVRAACEAAGIGRRTWYDWIEEDKQFALLVDEARDDVLDKLEETAQTRAEEGSDLLLMFLMKAGRPGRFRDHIKIDLVSPIVRDKVRQTVSVIRSSLEPALCEPLLKKLNEVWK